MQLEFVMKAKNNMKKVNKKSIFIFSVVTLILIAVVVTIIGLKGGNEKEYTEFKSKITDKNIKSMDYKEDYGMTDGVYHSILDDQGFVDSEHIYHLEEEDFFHFINIGNRIGKDMTFRLLAFNNYKQIDFDVDGTAAAYHDVYIQQGADLQIPVYIKSSQLNDGYNDLLFVIVIDPEFNQVPDGDHPYSDMMLYIRCTVYKNNEIIPEYQVTAQYEVLSDIEYFPDVMLHKNELEANRPLYEETINKGAVETYYMSIGNTSEEDENIAFIVLDNWLQKDNLSGITTVPAMNLVTASFDLEYGDEGLHNIRVITMSNVYREVIPFGVDVFYSNRLILHAK